MVNDNESLGLGDAVGVLERAVKGFSDKLEGGDESARVSLMAIRASLDKRVRDVIDVVLKVYDDRQAEAASSVNQARMQVFIDRFLAEGRDFDNPLVLTAEEFADMGTLFNVLGPNPCLRNGSCSALDAMQDLRVSGGVDVWIRVGDGKTRRLVNGVVLSFSGTAEPARAQFAIM